MSDQKRWFKVWTSILSDPCFSCLSPDDVGRWVRLGASIALSGNNGTITGSAEFFSRLLSCQNDIERTVARLPNISFKMLENCNGKFAVTMLNWNKYQLDSTGYERQQKFRNAKSVTVQDKIREDKIRKDKRREEILPLNPPVGDNNLPDWIPSEVWTDFLEMRKGIKKPMKEKAIKLAINKLSELRDAGEDPQKVLEQSIMNSWQGLFPVRKDKKQWEDKYL